ncbi:MAG: trigger factor [Melioribacteraceae bacterium]|nr:trigger factor [Melioribacteraceae bacterium]
MDTKVNVLSNVEHELEVTLSYDEISNEIKDAYKKEGKAISMPGFRKGKVPMHILKKTYGDAIEYKASEDIANKKFWEIVDEMKLEPISTPSMTDLDFVRDEKLSFKIKYEVKPVLELKDYTGLEIEKPKFKVKDSDIEAEIEHIKKSKAMFEETDTIGDKFHRITVDLQRKDKDGTPIIGSKSENIAIDLSDPGVAPSIVEGAIGKKIGEKFEFNFVDEHKHGEETHKEEFFYDAEIKKTEKLVFPEENEEFFKNVSNNKAANYDELKAHITENYQKYFDQQAESIFKNNLLKKVVDNNEFDPPKGYVDLLATRMVDSEKEHAKRHNHPSMSDDELKKQLYPRAEWNAKWQIIMEQIANKEKIKVEDSDLEELAKKDAESTGIPVEKLVKYYKDSKRDTAMLEEKVIDFLVENSKVIEVDPEQKSKEAKENKDEN